MVSERPNLKMDRSKTHRKPIVLYCSRTTQTQDNSEAEDPESDFPPCRVGNSPPLISRSPVTVPSRSRYYPRAASGVLQQPSSEDEPSNTGLGRTNIVNIIDVTATTSHTKVILHIP